MSESATRPLPDARPAVEGPAAGAHDLETLPIHGFRGTPEEIERQWYEQVYRGRGDRMAQLTWRAVLMGSLLGGVLSLTNLYIGLKAGWGFGVAITACILSYAIWTALHRAGIVRTPMTVLENNCMQSTASSAGYSTGGTLISAFAAWMLINDTAMPLGEMLAWVFLLSVLGVTMAIPMKRQMINVEQLRFRNLRFGGRERDGMRNEHLRARATGDQRQSCNEHSRDMAHWVPSARLLTRQDLLVLVVLVPKPGAQERIRFRRRGLAELARDLLGVGAPLHSRSVLFRSRIARARAAARDLAALAAARAATAARVTAVTAFTGALALRARAAALARLIALARLTGLS